VALFHKNWWFSWWLLCKVCLRRLAVIETSTAQICHSALVNGTGPTAASAVAKLPSALPMHCPKLWPLMSLKFLQYVLPHSQVMRAHKPEIKKHCLTCAPVPNTLVAIKGPLCLFLFLSAKRSHWGFPGTRHGSVPPHCYANLGLRAILINGMVCTYK